MRHRSSRLRLPQKPAHAKMMKRNLVTSILLYESVRTTKKRAQVVQPIVDRLITIAKTRPAHNAIRSINRVVTDTNASKKVMEVLKERYRDRSSGLTRIVPVGVRKGDGAEIVDITFVEGAEVPVATVSKTVKADKPQKKTEKTEKASKTKMTDKKIKKDSSKKKA